MASGAKAAAGRGGGNRVPDAGKAQASSKAGGRSGTGRRARGPRRNKKKPLKCGDSGKYGDLQKKDGQNQWDRDHVPSKAALKRKARQLAGGQKLCGDQLKAVEKVGESIAIPKWLHKMYSRTYGRKNNPSQIRRDALGKGGLQAAAKRDIAAIKKGLAGRKMSKECRTKYNAWARQTAARTNRQYNQMLRDAINK